MDPIVIDRLKKHWSEDYVGRKQDIMDLIAEIERLRAELEIVELERDARPEFSELIAKAEQNTALQDEIERLRAKLLVAVQENERLRAELSEVTKKAAELARAWKP